MPTSLPSAAIYLTAALLAGSQFPASAFAQTDTPTLPRTDAPGTPPADVTSAPKAVVPGADLSQTPPAAATGKPLPADSATLATLPSAGQTSVSSLAGTLTIASVKLENGSRASKVIGASVYNEANQKIGSIDDLILKDGDKVVVAIVSVGGFLGIGSKLIAVAYDQLHMDKDKAILAGASKEALNGLPSFTYGT